MDFLKKAFFDYFAWFGGTITLLTVCGYWPEVQEFLQNNRGFGLIASLFFIMFQSIKHHSVEAAAKLEFDRKRGKRKK